MAASTAYLNLNRILGNTLAEGPGLRFCLWTQGCLRRCPGCCNAGMLPIEPRLLVTIGEVCEMIERAHKETGIEGVTFLGGEPVLQAENLAYVAKFTHKIGLSVIVFTGFTYSECMAEPVPGTRMLLADTDVLIDGPFIKEQVDITRNWVGSYNQKFNYLTGRYSALIETDFRYNNIVEVRAGGNGVLVNGSPHVVSRIVQERNNRVMI